MIYSIFAYLLVLMGIVFYSHLRSKNSENKALDYFLGGRKLGIIPLAMTTAATYISASSFIGGPGVAYSKGLSWVFLASVQYPVNLLMMGLLGEQIRNLGHKHGLYDLADYIFWRYRSRYYSKFCALLIAFVLLLGLMVALMGGSRLLQGALGPQYGLSYRGALLIFSLALGFYTIWGGFRAVVLTDIVQGVWMLLASTILLVLLWYRIGGVQGLEAFASENKDAFLPDAGGSLPLSYTASFTILVGFGMIVQPISFSRLLAFERGKSLTKSILISLAVIGLLTFLPHFIGFLGRIVLPGLDAPDQVMGRLGQLFGGYGLFGSIFSGMLISAMLAAIMSTADSTINVLGMTIYRHLLPRSLSGLGLKDAKSTEARHFRISRLLACLAIFLVILLALEPPKLLVSLNLYALGITQVALFWPVLLGMLSHRPRAVSAVCATTLGLSSYIAFNWAFPSLGGVKLLPYSLLVSVAAYYLAFISKTLKRK